MSERIRYIEHKHRENQVISIREFVSKKSGARYRIILDLANFLFMIRNERTKEFVLKGGENINNLNVLKRTARKELESLGVEMERESRDRTFGRVPKGMTQKKWEAQKKDSLSQDG
jgi:hypothetical protein